MQVNLAARLREILTVVIPLVDLSQLTFISYQPLVTLLASSLGTCRLCPIHILYDFAFSLALHLRLHRPYHLLTLSSQLEILGLADLH